MLQIRSGMEHALDVLFREWYPRIVFFTKRYTGSESDAEEIACESFVKFWKIRTTFSSLANIKNFLYLSSRNAALNHIRQQKQSPLAALDDTTQLEAIHEEDPFYELEHLRSEVIGTLFREIDELPEKCREVVLLTYRDGLNTRQIAEKLNISVSNVTSQRNRAIQQLRLSLFKKFPLLTGICLPVLLKDILRNL
ncbi:MAG: RNA polymerase sigma factor [Chitinophagaceae bacterium]